MIHQRIGFGGGCHWCTEAVFQALHGVRSVKQGYIQVHAPFDNFSEAVSVEFDPAEIPLSVLVEIHLRTHANTSNHKLRGKYRSAIYTFNTDQKQEVEKIMDELQSDFDAPLVTKAFAICSIQIHFALINGSDPSLPNKHLLSKAGLRANFRFHN
ncbi:MAG: peptide-methionine (S)-S-oxide reductase [Salaquimonas sp.]